MKKLLSLFLVLLMIISIGSISFAATAEGGTVISDSKVLDMPVRNVATETYLQKQGSISRSENATIIDEETPGGAALPKTGGIPAEAFYTVGALFIVAALIVSKKKVKASSKN